MHTHLIIVALLVALGVTTGAQAPVPRALAEAKTVYLVNEGASQGMIDDVAKELRKWGRFDLVDNQAASDITITLGGLRAYRGWPMTITDSKDQSQLWTGAQKRGFTNKVSTDLVKKLRKLLNDEKR